MSWWHAVRGAARFAQAHARGDVALPQIQQARAAKCSACPNRRDYRVPALGRTVSFCGEAFKPGPGTCGCLVLADGEPAGKPTVDSERCPSGEW